MTGWIADGLRWVGAVGSLALVVSACYAIVLSEHADQRVRFGLFAGFGVLLTAGQLATLGHPASWRLPVLVVLVGLATWSTIMYARRERARHHGR